jgi:NADH-quinone oxidoreductase subunit M
MNISPLLLLLLAPLLAIFFIILLRSQPRLTALCAAGFNFIFSLVLIFGYINANTHGGYAFVMDVPWVTIHGIPPIHFHLAVDGISLPLVMLTGIVTLAAIFISPGNIRRASEYYCYLLLMTMGAMGAFISLDLFFFFIFHDFALIATFLLIGIWGSHNRQFVSFQVTIYLMAGSLILLAGFVALVTALPEQYRTFDIVALTQYIVGDGSYAHQAHPLSATQQATIFPLMLVGFGILVGLFPFHSWAPPGYASAPPAAAMLHAGILKKFAIYGLIRIAIPLLHTGFTDWLPVIFALLVGNFLYAGLVTMAQKELPLMIGFSSIMHMGYLFLGMACWNVIGLTGAVVLMVAHGLSAALMFGLSGEITARSGENRFAELGGLAKRAPMLAVLFSFASMATMGVPGLANFAGEVMIFFGSIGHAPLPFDLPIPLFAIFALIAIYGTVITAVFQLRAIKNVFYGPMPERYQGPPTAVAATAALSGGDTEIVPTTGMSDTSTWDEHGPYVLLVVASLIIGFMPFLLVNLIEPSVLLQPFLPK